MSMADRDTKTQDTKVEETRSATFTGFKELSGYIRELETAGDSKANQIILDSRKGILSDNLDGLKRMAVFWFVKGNEDRNRQNSGVERKLKELDNYFSKNKSNLNKYQGTSSVQMGESQKKEIFKFSSDILRKVNSIVEEASGGGGASSDERGLKAEWERFIREVNDYYKDLLAAAGVKSILEKGIGEEDEGFSEEDNGEQLEARRKEIKQRELPEARFLARKITMKHADILVETKKTMFSKLGYGRKGIADFSRYELVEVFPGVLTQAIKPDFSSLLYDGDLKDLEMKDKKPIFRPDKNENKRLKQRYKEIKFYISCGKKYEIYIANENINEIEIEIEALEGKISKLQAMKAGKDENKTNQIPKKINEIYDMMDKLYQEKKKMEKKRQSLKSGRSGSPGDKIEREKDDPEIKGVKVASGAYDEYRQAKWMTIENARHNIEQFAHDPKFRKNKNPKLLSNDYDENPIVLSNIYSEFDALFSEVLIQGSTHMDDEETKASKTPKTNDGILEVDKNEEFLGIEEVDKNEEFLGIEEVDKNEEFLGIEEVDRNQEFPYNGIEQVENYRYLWDYNIINVENQRDFGDYNIPEVNNDRTFGGRGGYYAPNIMNLMMMYMDAALSRAGASFTNGMNDRLNMPVVPAPLMYAMMNMGMVPPQLYGRNGDLDEQRQKNNGGVLDRIGNMNDEWEIMRATALTCTSMVISLFNQLYRSFDNDQAVSDLFHKSYEILSDWITYNNVDIENWKGKGRNLRFNVLYQDLIDYVRDMHNDLKSHLRDNHNGDYEERLVFRNINKVNEMLVAKDRFFNSGDNFENNFMIEMYDMLRDRKVKGADGIILGDVYKTNKKLIFNPTFFNFGVPISWWRVFL